MKNKCFIAFLVWFVLVGCDIGTNDNGTGNGNGNLEGQWKIIDSFYEDWVLVFRGDVLAFYKEGEPSWKGTFTPTGEVEYDYHGYTIIGTHEWENDSWTPTESYRPGMAIRFDDATHISIINVWTGMMTDLAVKGNWVTER
jgi:hypothetical protein